MFLKLPELIIIEFGENNFLCPKYIDINEFREGPKSTQMHIFHHTFFIHFSKKLKKYNSMSFELSYLKLKKNIMLNIFNIKKNSF